MTARRLPGGRGRAPATRLAERADEPPTLSARLERASARTVLRVRGTLRVDTAARLRELVSDALDDGPTELVLDLGDMVAGDDLGLWVLPAMAGDATRRRVPLLVVVPDRALRTRLRCLGGHPLDLTDRIA
jgi:anti-anti-sigma regulatory factor